MVITIILWSILGIAVITWLYRILTDIFSIWLKDIIWTWFGYFTDLFWSDYVYLFISIFWLIWVIFFARFIASRFSENAWHTANK